MLDLHSVLVDICGSDLFPFIINVQKLISLEEALCKVESSDPAAVSAIIDKYTEQPILKEDSAYQRLACDAPPQAHSCMHVCTNTCINICLTRFANICKLTSKFV